MNKNLVKALFYISGANGVSTKEDIQTLEDIISQAKSQLYYLKKGK